MTKKSSFLITVFTEDRPGIVQRVVSVFTKRNLNIESLTTSKSSMPGIHRFTIVVNVDEALVRKLRASLERQIDVVKAFYYHTDEVVMQEIALYKVPTKAFMNSSEVETLVRKHNAKILQIEEEYTVIEKSGHQEETELLLVELQKIGVFEFVRSGLVAVPKELEPLNKYLDELKFQTLTQN